MSKVVAMPGIVVQGNTEPVPAVIEMLEELLDEAKRGEIRCAIVGTVDAAGGIATISAGEASINNMMLIGVAIYEEVKEQWLGSARLSIPPDVI